MISILSIWLNTFSGLGISSISNSPVLWTKFSGLSIASIINWFINCTSKGSFSKAMISILSTWLNIFSGLGVFSNSNSPVLWTKFSGLGIASISNSFINWISKGSFSKAMISILSTWLKIFSGLCISSITNSPVCCVKFSGFGLAKIINSLINCVIKGSFSIPLISTLFICSKIFSSLLISSMNNWLINCTVNSSFSIPAIIILSPGFITKSGIDCFSIWSSIECWIIFSSLSNASILSSLIFCLTNSSFSYPIIVILSLSSTILSGFSVFIITTSSACWLWYSSLSNCSMVKAFINCFSKGSFSHPVISIPFVDSITFSSFSFFCKYISFFSWTKFSQGNLTPWINNIFIFCMVFSGFSKDIIFKPLFGSMIFSSFGFFSIVTLSILLSGWISSNHFSKIGWPLICNKLIFWCSKASFSSPDTNIPLTPSSTISSSQFLAIFNIDKSNWDISFISFQLFLSTIDKVFIGHNFTVLIQGWLSEYIPKP